MKTTLLLASLAIAAVASAAGQTYLEENFSDANWEDRWTTSGSRDDLGKFALASGKVSADKEYSKGLMTTEDHRFYQISTPFKSVVDNAKEDLFVQYTVKQDTPQECGGSYIKLLPEGFDAKTFNGDSEYAIMFGPDQCGNDNRIHVIFNHKGQNYLTKKEFPVPRDSKTHLYRLIVHPDQKYTLTVDGEVKVDKVALEEHWAFYGPKTIPDPSEKKPEDWVDDVQIEDVTHVKPENYDAIPRYIPDPDATQPEDWDEESDGEWEAAEVPNPDFEEWAPKYIPNPAYKGEWAAKEIPNPDYKEDSELAHYKIGGVGLDLWQVKSGSIFDDIIVTTDAELADKYLNQWKENSAKEEKIIAENEKKEKEEKVAEAKKDQEAQAAAQAAAEAAKVSAEADELDEEDEQPKAAVKILDVETEAETTAELDVELEAESAEGDSIAETVVDAIKVAAKKVGEKVVEVKEKVVEKMAEKKAEAEDIVEEKVAEASEKKAEGKEKVAETTEKVAEKVGEKASEKKAEAEAEVKEAKKETKAKKEAKKEAKEAKEAKKEEHDEL